MANLFLHYTLYKWLEKTDLTVKFARCADDAVIHCRSKGHADYILKKLDTRVKECGLELHPEKTKIVYCKDYIRKGKYPLVKFDFLGYSFQPRSIKSKTGSHMFFGFD